jgi:hypothetical protein
MNRRDLLRILAAAPIAAPIMATAASQPAMFSGGILTGADFGVIGAVPSEQFISAKLYHAMDRISVEEAADMAQRLAGWGGAGDNSVADQMREHDLFVDEVLEARA